MPTYHGLQTIFIHIPKCAGSGMAQRLYSENSKTDCKSVEFEKHESVSNVLEYMPYYLYLDYFKFAFVRNPYDRLVSWFHYYKVLWASGTAQRQPCSEKCIERFMPLTFSDWLSQLLPYGENGCSADVACPFHFIANQHEFITSQDKVLVNFIGRFENLSTDWEHVCNIIGFKTQPLAITNKTDRGQFVEYFSDKERELVLSRYENDFKYFGYDLDLGCKRPISRG